METDLFIYRQTDFIFTFHKNIKFYFYIPLKKIFYVNNVYSIRGYYHNKRLDITFHLGIFETKYTC